MKSRNSSRISSCASSGSPAASDLVLLDLLLGVLVDDVLDGEDRAAGAHRQGDGVGRAARHGGELAVTLQVELGEVGVLAHVRDQDADEVDAELVEHVLQEVVGQRAGALHALQGVGDGGRLGPADVDGQHPPAALLLPQEHDRGVGRKLQPHTDELHLHHAPTVPPPVAGGTRDPGTA